MERNASDQFPASAVLAGSGPCPVVVNWITMKYEADLSGDNDYLITLTPIRLTNNLEAFDLLPQVFWGVLLIAGAFLGECICRLIIFICKKLKTREQDNSEDVGDVEY